MAIIRFTSNRRIARGPQVVRVNKGGSWRTIAGAYCETINRGMGSAGSSATFIVPKMRWDDARDKFTGAEVMVLAAENNSRSTGSQPWFHGWITGEPKRKGPRVNSYSFSAVSAVKMMDKMPVGVGSWTWKDYDGTKILRYLKKGISAIYPRLSAMRYGRRAVLWRPKEVMQDIFDGLPSFWKQAVGLGDVAVLRQEPFQKKGLVEWDFTAVSVLDAVESLVAAYGDVGFIERYNGAGLPRVELDFFRIGEGGRGRKRFYVPECGSERLGVKEISGNTETGDRIDRVILAGAPYRIMLTTWTGDPDLAKRLRKGWVTKPVTITTTTWDEESNAAVTEAVTKTNEEWVLDDPDYGRRESDLFHPDCEWVFRRYYLPPCLLSRGIKVEKDNAVRQIQSTPAEDDPKRLSRQVFKTRLTYSTRQTDYEVAEYMAQMGRLTSSYGYDCASDYGEGYGYQTPAGFRLLNLSAADLVGELVNDEVSSLLFHPLELMDGAEIGADGTVILSEPAINIIFKGYCGTKEQIVRAEADVALTITVIRESRLEMDTGQPPYEPGRMSLIGRDGCVFSDCKEDSWMYEQITNLGTGPRLENGEYVSFDFADPNTGAPVYFDYCVYCLEYDPDADDPELVKLADNEQLILTHVVGQQVLRNDYPIMQELGSRILKLKSRPNRTYEVTLPVATRAYQPGDVVAFIGIDDVVDDDYMITDVAVDFDPTGPDWSTTLSITNGKPEESSRIDY